MHRLGSLSLYSVEEVSQRLETNPKTIRTYIKQGKLQAKRFGRRYWISQKSLEEFFESAILPQTVTPST